MKFSTRRLFAVKNSGFTLREILIIVVVISVGLLSVLVVLTNGIKYVQKTRYKVIALNLAREWMESVYQMRDTNWTKRAWVKDSCWLKINPLVDEWIEKCIDDSRFVSGSYVLQRLTTGGQEYFALTGPFLTGVYLDDGIDSGDLHFSLCQQSGYWDACPWVDSVTSEGRYFRQIEWRWLYFKDSLTTWWTAAICTSWASYPCADASAKEFRFCSRVVYVGDGTGEVSLCGLITNFKGK